VDLTQNSTGKERRSWRLEPVVVGEFSHGKPGDPIGLSMVNIEMEILLYLLVYTLVCPSV